MGALVYKEFKKRYASSFMGLLWAVLQPLFTVLIYTFIFSFVLHTPVPESYKSVPYVVFLMTGLIPFQIFSETVGRSCSILLENKSMITKTVFPYELLPVSILIISLISAGITLVIVFVLMLIFGQTPNLTSIAYLPLFFVPLIFMTIGISWMVSCLSVIFGDIAHIMPMVLNLIFFSTPILYSYEMIENLNSEYPWLVLMVKLNPLYAIVKGHRMAFIGHNITLDYGSIMLMNLIAILLFLTGWMIFYYLKKEIADLF